MNRRRKLLLLGAVVLAVAPALSVSFRVWDAERREMGRRFDRIEIGMSKSEAEAAIGMENNGMSYTRQRPVLVAGRDSDFDSEEFSAAYQCDRYTILIHFEPGHVDRVTGKGLFRSVEGTGFAEQLSDLAERLFAP